MKKKKQHLPYVVSFANPPMKIFLHIQYNCEERNKKEPILFSLMDPIFAGNKQNKANWEIEKEADEPRAGAVAGLRMTAIGFRTHCCVWGRILVERIRGGSKAMSLSWAQMQIRVLGGEYNNLYYGKNINAYLWNAYLWNVKFTTLSQPIEFLVKRFLFLDNDW